MTLRNLTKALAVAAVCAAAASANAATQCVDTADNSKVVTNPIYLAGSTALGPTLQALAPAASALGYTLVHYNSGSCGAVANITAGSNAIPASTGSAPPAYYLPDGSGKRSCVPMDDTHSAQVAATIDVVLSDVDARLCPGISGLAAGFTDATGPVNAMIFAVPGNSQQNAISAEQAYLVFGKGADGAVSPWIGDPATTYSIRKPSSGTRAMINANIGDPDHGGAGGKGTKKDWFGNPLGGAGDVINALTAANSTAANSAIGILGLNDLLLNLVSATPAPIRALAFRAFHQKQAYWTGSTRTSKDARNIRDGRYKIWGYVHMITPTTGASAAATAFVNLVNDPGAIEGIVKAGLTPVCAMHVTHDYEGQDQKPYAAAKPCDCFFEKAATTSAPTSCKSCSADSECGTGRCDKHALMGQTVGYCEAK